MDQIDIFAESGVAQQMSGHMGETARNPNNAAH